MVKNPKSKTAANERYHALILSILAVAIAMMPAHSGDLTPQQVRQATAIRCNNLIYGNGQTSVCFADKFLSTAAAETGLTVMPKFFPVKLESPEFFDSPFTVISGTGKFRFSAKERENLRRYLMCGGFLLVSPGCSDAAWDVAFRNELKGIMPDAPLTKLPMSHPLFATVFKISTLNLKSGGRTLVEGLELNGRLALIYSTEGLNDSHNAQGCCCCGGNMIKESEQVNVNILVYSLLH
jgi:hypothetical protein